MVGKGLMMFEDETIYEGNFAGMYTLPKLRSALPPTKKNSPNNWLPIPSLSGELFLYR